MAASSGEGDRSPAAAAAPWAVVDDLIDVRDRAVMLHDMLHGSSPTPQSAVGGSKELMEGMMSSLSSALSALDTTGGRGASSSSAAGRRPASSSSGGRRKKSGPVAAPHRRISSSRRRTQSPFCKSVTVNTLDDGKTWRKYGQKEIQDFPNNPRSYYRCTHKPDQGCKATRQVQTSEANPSEYVISYFGEHTCRDPSTIPLFINAATAPPDCRNLISFGSAAIGTVASTSSTACGFMRVDQAVAAGPALLPRFVGGYSSSLPEQDWRRGGEREAFSRSSSPAAAGCLASVVGLAAARTPPPATVGSAPEYYWPGDMAGGIGTGSFPSSPSSLGFMTGSFGSLNGGDDDLFGFDS